VGLLTALIGLLGVVVGVFLNEFIRRQSRIESFAEQVFQRRLKVYEDLYILVDRAQGLAYQLLDDDVLDSEQRHAIWSGMVLEIARFGDGHGLYLSEEIMLHCMMMLMGIEEIPEIQNEEERSAAQGELSRNFKTAREMIAEESGMCEVNRVLGKIAKTAYESDLVENARRVRERYGARER
jgi:hypothetical protein